LKHGQLPNCDDPTMIFTAAAQAAEGDRCPSIRAVIIQRY
jgi:hypothetical protein